MLSLDTIPRSEVQETIWLKIGWFILGILIIILLTFYFFETVQAAALSQDDIVKRVINNNPELSALRHSAEAAKNRISQTGSFADPSISYRAGSNAALDLIQPLKNPGKQWSEIEAAKLEAELATFNYITAERELVTQIKQIYAQIYAIDQTLQIVTQEQRNQEVMYQAALRRYETGQVTQQDPLRATLALVELKTRISELIQKRESFLVQLKQISGGQEIVLATVNAIVVPERVDTLPVLRAMLKNNPDILSAESGYQKALKEQAGAQTINQPEFELGVEYTPAMGETMAMAAVSLPLWWNKNSARQDESTALVQAASKNYESVVQAKSYELENIYLKINQTGATLKLYREHYLPLTQQASIIAKTGYLSGKIDFSEWLGMETKQLETQLKYTELIAAQAMLFADLEKISGKEQVYAKN